MNILKRTLSKSWARTFGVRLLLAVFVPFLAAEVGDASAPSKSSIIAAETVAVRKAQQSLAAGRVDDARSAIQPFASRRAEDGEWAVGRMLNQIDAAGVPSPVGPTGAGNQQAASDPHLEGPEEAFVDRVQHYWLAQAKAISTTPPQDADAYRDRLNSLQMLEDDLADANTLKLSPAQETIRREFVDALAAKQSRLFPVLRRAYGRALDQNLFREDVRVSVSGSNATTIRLTGTAFVRNANIADTEAGIESDVRKARFRRLEFRWNDAIGGTTGYTINGPTDAEVGTMDSDGLFTKAAR